MQRERMTLRSLKVEGVSAFCKQGMMFYMKRTPDNIIFAKALDRPAVRSNGRLVQLKAFLIFLHKLRNWLTGLSLLAKIGGYGYFRVPNTVGSPWSIFDALFFLPWVRDFPLYFLCLC
jgi:hypothetical protein